MVVGRLSAAFARVVSLLRRSPGQRLRFEKVGCEGGTGRAFPQLGSLQFELAGNGLFFSQFFEKPELAICDFKVICKVCAIQL